MIGKEVGVVGLKAEENWLFSVLTMVSLSVMVAPLESTSEQIWLVEPFWLFI